MFKNYAVRSVRFARRLAGKLSQHRDTIMLAYIILLGLTLPAFYPDHQQEIISQHNGIMLGMGILAFVFLLILDSTALYDDDDLLDKFTDAWIDLDEDHKRMVVDSVNAIRDTQRLVDLAHEIDRLPVEGKAAVNGMIDTMIEKGE